MSQSNVQLDDLLYQAIGEKIRVARNDMKLSQAELADRLQISRASVVNIEAGRQRPPLHLVWRIAEHLNTELVFLIPRSNELKNQEVLLDEDTIAQIETAANGDPFVKKSLVEFINRAKSK